MKSRLIASLALAAVPFCTCGRASRAEIVQNTPDGSFLYQFSPNGQVSKIPLNPGYLGGAGTPTPTPGTAAGQAAQVPAPVPTIVVQCQCPGSAGQAGVPTVAQPGQAASQSAAATDGQDSSTVAGSAGSDMGSY